MQAFVELAAAGKLDLEPLISRRVPVAEAATAYEELDGRQRLAARDRPPLRRDRGRRRRRSRRVALQLAKPRGGPARRRRRSARAASRSGFSFPRCATRASSFTRWRAHADCRRAPRRSGSGSSGPSARTSCLPTPPSGSSSSPRATRRMPLSQPLRCAPARPSSSRSRRASRSRVWRICGGRSVETGLPLAVGFNRRHAPLAVELRGTSAKQAGRSRSSAASTPGRFPDDHWLNDRRGGRRAARRRGLPLRRPSSAGSSGAARRSSRRICGRSRSADRRGAELHGRPRVRRRLARHDPLRRRRRVRGSGRSTSRRTPAAAPRSSTTTGRSTSTTAASTGGSERGAATRDTQRSSAICGGCSPARQRRRAVPARHDARDAHGAARCRERPVAIS